MNRLTACSAGTGKLACLHLAVDGTPGYASHGHYIVDIE